MTTPVVPVYKDSPLCRYHAAGRCDNGQTCKYQHGNEGTPRALVIFAVSSPNSPAILGTGIEYWSQSQTDPVSSSEGLGAFTHI